MSFLTNKIPDGCVISYEDVKNRVISVTDAYYIKGKDLFMSSAAPIALDTRNNFKKIENIIKSRDNMLTPSFNNLIAGFKLLKIKNSGFAFSVDEKVRNITYFKKSYKIKSPKMIYTVAVNKKEIKIKVFCYIRDTNSFIHFPFGNVFFEGNPCWSDKDANSLCSGDRNYILKNKAFVYIENNKNIINLDILSFYIDDRFFMSPFNNDLVLLPMSDLFWDEENNKYYRNSKLDFEQAKYNRTLENILNF